ARLAQARGAGITGINLGANKDSADMGADFARVLATCGTHVDFATVNVSSPNTAGLRGLQAGAALTRVLAQVSAARDALPRRVALFVKVAPDLDDAALAALADAAEAAGLDGIVATNTTLARDGLRSAWAGEAGGLSGLPLRARAMAVLARLHAQTGGRLALIGVGGISSAEDAYARIRAGASALQLYTALVYQGPSLVARILHGLDALLLRDGFADVAEAVGTASEEEIAQWTT
ncbi:MAG: dihydroorotate dehydrogenase (quinone), partial [Thermohalobaculum sp.]|nr:dihydroorotate dehydrogenase (quinone) [Thermohalobaculum sp.]